MTNSYLTVHNHHKNLTLNKGWSVAITHGAPQHHNQGEMMSKMSLKHQLYMYSTSIIIHLHVNML